MARFEGTPANDSYAGTDADDIINGYGGDDKLAGGKGADTINGGDGTNWLASYQLTYFQFGTFDRHFQSLDIYADHDVLTGGAGSDVFEVGYGDSVDGGPGATAYATMNYLTINLRGATAGVVADFHDFPTFGSITIGGGTITNIGTTTTIVGSDFDDVIRPLGSTALFAWVYGGAGNDRLTSDYYTDFLDGGAGDDILDGRAGGYLTQLNGGEGNDTFYTALGSNASAGGGAGNDIFYTYRETYGGDGDDKIYLQGVGGRIYGDAGNDEIRASDQGNSFEGGAGADLLIGGAGDDDIYAGSMGTATAAGDAGTEHDVLTGGGGNDRLSIGYGDDADGGTGVNALILSLGGATAAINLSLGSLLTGDTLPNATLGGSVLKNIQQVALVWGTAFDDTLAMPNQSITGTVHGGLGDDRLSGSGTAVILYGDEGNDQLTGSSAFDTLYGGFGNDTIDGGLGVDTMWGGAGNDTFYVDNAGDRVNENSGEGSDTIISSITFSLANAVNVETLVLSGTAAINGSAGTGTTSYTLYGNAADNLLTGGLGQDKLYGGGGNDRIDGGAGADTMYGGAGDDVFVVDNAGDVVVEYAGDGDDTVKASVDFSIAGMAGIEYLRLTGTAVRATGNAGRNTLVGNEGDNVLDSGGGGDRMKGGYGNDTYIVRDAADVVVEFADSGSSDVVKAAVSYTLGAGAWVETLRTIDAAATTAIDLTGNAYSHAIEGNAGANVLTAGSGDDRLSGFGGNDTLYGGGGADLFVFDHGAGQDVVGDFVSGTDRLDLSAFFTTFADMQAAASDSGGDVTIDLGNGDSVTLTGVSAAQLQSGDVIVGTAAAIPEAKLAWHHWPVEMMPVW